MQLLHLELSARPESVSAIRRAVAEAAAKSGADADAVDRLRIAVTEVCANVVRHAYEDEGGAILVDLTCDGGGFDLVVRDDGGGFGASTRKGLGAGLALIAAVSDSFRVAPRDGVPGTEVHVRVAAGAPLTTAATAGSRT